MQIDNVLFSIIVNFIIETWKNLKLETISSMP